MEKSEVLRYDSGYLFIYDLSYMQLIKSLISWLYKLKIQEKHTMVQNYDGIAISQLGNTQLEILNYFSKCVNFIEIFH